MMEPTRPSASRNWKPFTVFGLLLILLILLLQPSLYAVTMVNYALITVSLAVSLQLIFGFAGQVSLAHAAFFGIGAYVSAILSVRYGWPFLLALPAAGLAASLVSLLLAPLGRLREHYFAMATLAFGLITYRFFASWQEITGGWLGIGNIPKPSFFGLLPIGSARAFLVLLAAALAVQYVFMNRLTSGRLGRNFRSIRDDEVAAASLGIPVGRSKMQAVILGCFWAGLAGSLMAHLNGFISPEPFSFWYSVLLALMVVVGGLGSFPGAALGSMGLTLVNEGLKETVLLRPILYGALIVILMIYLPEGLAGGYQRLLGRRGRGRGG
ncbi:MAG: branched-chain amino acid ABC transporter permease, partial [Firmicutes bacterium]|nr:branched-chain amino acid ABC transporter permease [Bacillota bacterium]